MVTTPWEGDGDWEGLERRWELWKTRNVEESMLGCRCQGLTSLDGVEGMELAVPWRHV